ncbi:hypothetical protein D9758_010494 [Tetrapyrgos nigripes]|uniref:Uncharacterized protein n=1 Tax=Tetrapyrgos nigripes TaxID=182062 RepID=A0A8H5CZK5_9AGAR|nr:hypothetical protein D9758_010494 [Tetrapyrgos nigripes]
MLIRHSKPSSVTGTRLYHVSSTLAGKSIASHSIPKLSPEESRGHRTAKFDRNGRTSSGQLIHARRMSDFVRSKASKVGNWWSEEGSPATKTTDSEPSPYAYEPHTVYLLESRYPVRYGNGRVEAPEHLVGICRASDFEAVVKMYNSLEAPQESLTAMDNARWPWTKSPSGEPEKLYAVSESKENSEDASGSSSMSIEDSLRQVSSDEGLQAAMQKDARRHMSQTIAVAERVSEESLGDLPDAHMKRWEGKIPFEVELDDGTVTHPSGYIPPTAVHQFGDTDHYSRAHTQTAARARDAEIKSLEYHSDPSVQVRQWEAVKEREEEEGPLMSQLTEGILAGGVSAATEPKDSKIPTELHGVHIDAVAQPMQHPSGFIPPTAGMARGEKDARTEVIPGEHIPPELPIAEERPPTFSSSDSPLSTTTTFLESDDVQSSVERSLTRSGSQSLVNRFDEHLREVRLQYATHIHQEPFWRPLLSFTVSTRPLAITLARLSQSSEKGLPFHTAVSEEDGKDIPYSARMQDIRLERMRMLGLELSKLLAGAARSGFAGIRFAPKEKGRHITVDGEDRPIEWERRVIGVGVGEWNPLAPQIKEFFEKDATEAVQQLLNEPEDSAPFLIFGIDEWGHSNENVRGPWESLMLQDNVKDDTIKVLQEIQGLQQWLSGRNLNARIFVPKFYGQDHTPLKHELKVAEGRLPIVLATDGETPPEGHIEVTGSRARRFVNERIQKLYELNQDAIAATVSIRHRSVTYPKQSQSFEEEVEEK